jgi:hypothetical protein
MHTIDFGAGDRKEGIRFAVYNFQYTNEADSSTYAMRRVGAWSSEDGFSPCTEDDSRYHVSWLGGCHSMDYGTSDSSIPKDRADPIEERMPAPLKALLVALFVIELCVVVFFGAVLVMYRKTRIMKAAQLPMMWLVLMMGLYGSWRVFLSSRDATVEVCYANFWLGHLAFTGLIALFAKTLRVHLVVNSGKLRRVKITTTHVLGFTLVLFAVMVGYMIILSGVDPQRVLVMTSEAITGQATHQYYCTTEHPSLDYALYAFEGLILALSAKLCYDTKDVPDAINEAHIVSGGMY